MNLFDLFMVTLVLAALYYHATHCGKCNYGKTRCDLCNYAKKHADETKKVLEYFNKENKSDN